MAAGLTPPPTLQLSSHFDFKPPPTMLKILVFVVTSHSPHYPARLPCPPTPTCSAEEEATITTWEPRNILAWALAGSLEQEGLKDMETAYREVGTSVTARGRERFGRLLLQKVFLSSPRFLGAGNQVPLFTVFTSLSVTCR